MSQSFDNISYGNIKKLSKEELDELWARYFADRTNKQLRDELIVQYISLVKFVVGRVRAVIPYNISIEDITSYGVEGLINAIDRYSVVKNSKFENYAIIRIRGNIIDKVRQGDFIPRSVYRRIKEVKDAQELLRKKFFRMPTTSEIANYLNTTEERVNQILCESTSVTSIYDKKSTEEDGISIIDTIEDTNSINPLDKLEEADIKDHLEKALKRIPERERIILVLYYQNNMTLKEIGETLDMSESRTCQLHSLALMRLKKILSRTRYYRLRRRIIASS